MNKTTYMLLRASYILTFILLSSCSTSQRSTNRGETFIRLNTVSSNEIAATTELAYKIFTNCYGREEFPDMDEIATVEFLSSQKKTEKRFIYICNKYGHRYEKPEQLNLYEIAGDPKGNKYFVYKVSFPNSEDKHRLIVVKNKNNLIADIQHEERWKSFL